eukprot:2861318-Amphidinium_carterae.1
MIGEGCGAPRLMESAAIFACSAKTRLGKDTLWRKVWTAIGCSASLMLNSKVTLKVGWTKL